MEIIHVEHLHTVSELFQDLHGILSAAEYPHGINLKIHIVRVSILHQQLQCGFSLKFLKLMGMVVIDIFKPILF